MDRKFLSLITCFVVAFGLLNYSRPSVAVSLTPSALGQSALSFATSETIEGPQDNSDDIPWCDPDLFKEPVDFSKVRQPELSDFPPKPKCKLRTIGQRLSADEIQERINATLARDPQIKNIEQVDKPSAMRQGFHTDSLSFTSLPLIKNIQWERPISYFGQPRRFESTLNRPLMQAGNVYKYAAHRLTCVAWNDCSTSAPGVDTMTFNVSTYTPTPVNGGNWNSLHFYNRVHIGHPSYSSCAFYANLSMGYAYGKLGGVIRNGRLIYELFGGGQCGTFDTGVIPQGIGNISMWIARDSGTTTWKGLIWTGSWYQAFSWATTFSTAADIEAGGELWADIGANLNQILLPVNMINKLSIAGTNTGGLKPWHNYVLNAPLNTRSTGSTDAPFAIMDGNGWDRTSIAFNYYH